MKSKVVLITGNFNVLHPGHIRLFKFAKNFAEKLIVGVFSDKLAKEFVDVEEELRVEAVSSIDLIDEVHLIESTLEDFLAQTKPDVVIKGKEYENRDNPELAVLNSYGGKLIFSSGDITLTRFEPRENSLTIPSFTNDTINSFLDRHNISSCTIKEKELMNSPGREFV